MTQPTSYVPATDFSAEEAASTSGRSTVRTVQLDAELAAVSLSVTQIISNLSLVQRDDTELQDQIVKTHTLHPAVLTLIGSDGLNPRGLWVTSTAYAVMDLVESSGSSYICVTAHTSGVFATDYAAEKWMIMTPVGAAATTNFFKPSNGTPAASPTSAGTDAVAIGSGAAVSGTRAIAIGKANATGTDSLAASITDSTTSYGAQATQSIAIGKLAKVATGCTGGVAIGGDTNTVSAGTQGAIVGGGSNTLSGPNGFMGGGSGNTGGTGSFNAILGGASNSIGNGDNSCGMLGGSGNSIPASSITHIGMIGGTGNTAGASYEAILGGSATRGRLTGQVVWGAQAAVGDGQASHVVAQGVTTNATPTSIYTSTSAGTRILIASGSTAAFSILVCARRADVTGEAAAYKFEGLIANNGGTTAIVGAVTKTVIAESTAAWDCAVTADNTNDAIDISVTGEAAKTIKWAANITMVEIGLT